MNSLQRKLNTLELLLGNYRHVLSELRMQRKHLDDNIKNTLEMMIMARREILHYENMKKGERK